MYVILNRKPYDSKPAGNWYVAPPGSERSYTRSLENARRYASQEEAERDACGNESIVSLSRLLDA